ncbi:MAG: translation initiation factor eIF-2B [Nanobdellota archaeon]
MSLNSVCRDIKSLKIQGAVAVAREATKALYEHSKTITTDDPEKFLNYLKKASEKLIATRETEPALRNAMGYYFHKLNTKSVEKLKTHIELKHEEILNHFRDAEKEIRVMGSRRIKNGDIVYTHCHSSTVCNILKEAKRKGIDFEVHNTETRPLYQGRKTAKELSEAGIKVTHYTDSAARHAIKKADLVLLGADAITTTKVFNKVGSELFAKEACDRDIPVLCCTDSWKVDPESVFGFLEEIEERHRKEVWPDAPENVTIHNYAFDMINPKYITGIISELGVYEHSSFIEEVRKSFDFLF